MKTLYRIVGTAVVFGFSSFLIGLFMFFVMLAGNPKVEPFVVLLMAGGLFLALGGIMGIAHIEAREKRNYKD